VVGVTAVNLAPFVGGGQGVNPCGHCGCGVTAAYPSGFGP
jgi:hypothetical protein